MTLLQETHRFLMATATLPGAGVYLFFSLTFGCCSSQLLWPVSPGRCALCHTTYSFPITCCCFLHVQLDNVWQAAASALHIRLPL
jgi:hypothetical protein